LVYADVCCFFDVAREHWIFVTSCSTMQYRKENNIPLHDIAVAAEAFSHPEFTYHKEETGGTTQI